MRWVWLFVAFLIAISGCSLVQRQTDIAESDIGVLVLAHGAGKEWDLAVLDAVASVRGNYKKEIAFGMGDAKTIQRAIDKLESAGAKKIVVVPLFLSSHSEMYRQIEYVLGSRDEPDILFWILMDAAGSENEHKEHGASSNMLEKVKFKVSYKIASPINYHPLIAKILEGRLDEIISASELASVFILAHGPISAEDNKEWLRDLEKYGKLLSTKFESAKFFGMTFRDDAPPFIKDAAIKKIQDAVALEKSKGRKVIVVPFLLAPGGREEEVKRILENCGCEIIDGAILPHQNVSKWIEEQLKPR